MFSLSSWSRRQSGSEFQVYGPGTPKHWRPNCPVGSPGQSTSADWRTADVDDQQRLLLPCSCSSGTAEQFHEDIGTSTRPAWFVFDRIRRRASEQDMTLCAKTKFLPWFCSYHGTCVVFPLINWLSDWLIDWLIEPYNRRMIYLPVPYLSR